MIREVVSSVNQNIDFYGLEKRIFCLESKAFQKPPQQLGETVLLHIIVTHIFNYDIVVVIIVIITTVITY